jgi:hypothetical protein
MFAGAGLQRVTLRARNDRGHALAPGVYFYQVSSNAGRSSESMVIRR